MDTKSLQIVVLTERLGSFAAAARALDIDPSSVSRTVAAVEAELRLRLFQRTTRRLTTTEAGESYIRRITPLVEELDRAGEEAGAKRGTPTGTLRLTASVAFAQESIVPHLGQFLELYPKLDIDLIPSDANIDLLSEGIDLAIRLSAAPKGDLISTRLCATRYCIVAAPDYVETAPPLKVPEDLSRHNCLRFNLPQYRDSWLFRTKDGASFDVPVSGRVTVTNALALRQAARDGLGPALLPDWLVNRDIAAGTLIDLFPDHDCTATTFDTAAWALYPSRSYLPRKVRVAIDFLKKSLAVPK